MDWLGYLITAFIAIFLLFNLLPLARARWVRGSMVPELDAVLTDVQRRAPRLLVYFWSPTCGPCRSMTPIIDRLAAEGDAIVKVNVAEAVELAKHFGVMATPSLAVVEHGVLRQLVVGARNEAQIRALRDGGA
jgi:thioredoxin-like negative regulator of GroEL